MEYFDKCKKKSPFQKRLIPSPLRLHAAIETLQKIFRLTILFVRRPIAADNAADGDYRLKNPVVAVRVMAVLWVKNDVAAFVTDEVLVVRRYQKALRGTETTCAAVVSKVKLVAVDALFAEITAQNFDSTAALARIQARPSYKIFKCGGLTAAEIFAGEHCKYFVSVDDSSRRQLVGG